MATFNDPELEDPFDWSIDQVVHQFCNNRRPVWSPDRPPSHLPDPIIFEQALRDNDINGESLFALDAPALKADLGVVSFGQRLTLLKAISTLRNASNKFQRPGFQADALARFGSAAFATPQMTASRISPLVQSPDFSGYGLAFAANPQPKFGTPGFDNLAEFSHPPVPMAQANTLLIQSSASPRMRPSFHPSEPRGTPFPHLQMDNGQNNSTDQEQEQSNATEDTSLLNNSSIIFNDIIINSREGRAYPHPEDQDSISNTLNATPITSLPKADNQYTMREKDAVTSRQVDPRIIHGTEKERKRLIPTLVPNITLFPNVAQLQTSSSYLHTSAQHVHNLFEQTSLDQSENFSFVSPDGPKGQRQYVGRLMKYALRQPVKLFPGTETRYKQLNSRKSKSSLDNPRLFMVFVPGAEAEVKDYYEEPGFHDLNQIPRRRGRKPYDIVKGLTGEPLSANPFTVKLDPNSNGADFDYLLEKYPVSTDTEEDLPEYGDSGDEGEYDDETWQEIQAELLERQQEKGASMMTKPEIGRAIDEAIEDFKSKWHKEALPKVKVKAYRLWTKATRERSHMQRIHEAETRIYKLDLRMAKLRSAIMDEVWFKPEGIKKQSEILDMTVFEREENLYFIQVLGATSPPPQPDHLTISQARNLKKQTQMPEGEELLDSDSDLSLLDFVENDDSDFSSIPHDAPNAEMDANLARLQEQFARNRSHPMPILMESLQEETISDGSPELGSATRESPQKDSDNSPQTRASSESSEDAIITPADRKKMLRRHAPIDDSPSEQINFHTSADFDEDNMDVDADGENTDQDSDSDLPRLPRTKYRDHGSSRIEVIDLTFSSSPSGVERTYDGEIGDFEVTTPDLNPPDDDAIPKIKLGLSKATPASSKSTGWSSSLIVSQRPSDSDLPDVRNVEEMQQLDWEMVTDEGDRRRALAKAVYELEIKVAKDLRSYMKNNHRTANFLRDPLRNELLALNGNIRRKQTGSGRTSRCLRLLPRLFLTFVCYTNMMNVPSVSQADIDEAYEALDSARSPFHACLWLALEAYCLYEPIPAQRSLQKRKVEESEIEDELVTDSDLFPQTTDSERFQAHEEPLSRKKRKREVKESQEARSQQLNDQQRVKEEKKRRLLMAEKLLAMDVTGDEPSTKVINSIDPYITLDPHIGSRVKPHQVDGISFMWREIITDTKQQGCLLAHTMGLGKTMQVISLLCTISQAGKSPNKDVRKQVPKDMRKLTALILCPPSLTDNWYDELVMWIPEAGLLGPIYQISKERKELRFNFIKKWAIEGGILLLSYELFRAMIVNKTLRGKKPYDDEEHEELEEYLLKSPNIIIADEAHRMKNANSQISKVAKRFDSCRRIALTGSPLNNHLEEYHTMIDWIAPGYLGDIVQFKSKYSDPINEGLYLDSSTFEKRMSLRKLHVLKRDLAPKIDRADISAIENDMPPKTEFFITIILTPLQQKAYDILIDHILGQKKTSNAQLWTWISVFGLLCNHPSCFVRKLRSQNELSDLDSVVPDEDDSGKAPEQVPLSELDISAAVKEQAVKLYDDYDWSNLLGTVELSHRAHIAKQIIDESRRIGDKVLIFSHHLPTLDYLEDLIEEMKCPFSRIDGSTTMSTRQETTKVFNTHDSGPQVFLISMRAGGLGLNLQGANRVIIFDFNFNPSHEEQAIGRAFRLGQRKPVFVYRFRTGGTFEDILYNTTVFKTQLFQRVVDKKRYQGRASRKARDYLFRVKDVEQKDFAESLNKDPDVLDLIIPRVDCIRNIELTETFQKDEDEDLTPDERKLAEDEYENQVLERTNPEAYRLKKQKEEEEQRAAQLAAMPRQAALSYLQTTNQTMQGIVNPPFAALGRPLGPMAPSAGLLFGAFPATVRRQTAVVSQASDDILHRGLSTAGDITMPDVLLLRASSEAPEKITQMD